MRFPSLVAAGSSALLLTLGAHADDAPQTVDVYGDAPSAQGTQRGISDVRVARDQLEASPRQHASELLSAAPGFFVDHEDGEGFGNDVYLRGFDLDHGSGIEMRLGPLPINVPTHVQGQGYADADFIIPEVVQSVRVLAGSYDPRQGDSAIVGSAHFELGVAERGYQVQLGGGSFGQRRLLAIAAPAGLRSDTFVAAALRRTDGFGVRRAGQSASLNSGLGVELGRATQLRLIATAHAASGQLPGVVREDDVRAGRIDYYGSYPFFTENQGVRSRRVTLSAELLHAPRGAARLSLAPWLMWTDFRARQNYTGALETSQEDPTLSGLGDLFETKNRELAAGLSSSARLNGGWLREAKVALEVGTQLRAGRTQQHKSLLAPQELTVWDRRLAADLTTLDAGAYLDADWRFLRWLRLAGGVRADSLSVSVSDRLRERGSMGSAEVGNPVGARRFAAGVAVSPRATLELRPSPGLLVSTSYGEGYRSLDAAHLADGNDAPYSKVRSLELGARAADAAERLVSSLAMFRTYVENELVFAAEEGGLETQRQSTRSGVVGSLLARPTSWFIASAALSITSARFDTRVPGVSHHVPSVPPLLFHGDVGLRGGVLQFERRPVVGRLGVGYTFLSGRHLSDARLGPATHALNASAGVRYGAVELGLDAYNLLGLQYADAAELYISNWSFKPGQQPASLATHVSAAPPFSALVSVTLHL
ncbi:MAG: TonB-dependent receptor [Polyangiaceae bacterium]